MRVAVKEFCPVSPSLLARMLRSSPQGLAVLVRTVPNEIRAALAVYCSRRADLASLGSAIAATCNESGLYAQAGEAGRRLFAAATEANGALLVARAEDALAFGRRDARSRESCRHSRADVAAPALDRFD